MATGLPAGGKVEIELPGDVIYGNPLIPRSYSTDSFIETMGYLTQSPLPSGVLVDVRTYVTEVNAWGRTFKAMILRPTGVANEYRCVYKSNSLTVPSANGLAVFPISTNVLAGDVLSWRGMGIGMDINASGVTFLYPALEPTVGDVFKTDGTTTGYTLYSQQRIYSFAATIHVNATWTDVTQWVEGDAITIKRGRTSEFGAPSVGTLDGLRLDNTTGRFTPLCQTMVDGTANPYYPNLLPRKRIRYSNTPAGVRFVGYVKGWPPMVDQNGTAWVTISATDRLDQLSRITLQSAVTQEIQQSNPSWWWPLTDPEASTQAAERHGKTPLGIVSPALGGATDQPVVFGSTGPGVGDGTGVAFSTDNRGTGQILRVPGLFNPLSLELYVNLGTTVPAWAVTNFWDGNTYETILSIGLETAWSDTTYSNLAYWQTYAGVGQLRFWDGTGQVHFDGTITDNGWHHIALTRPSIGGDWTIRVDGVAGNLDVSGSDSVAHPYLWIGDNALEYGRMCGNVGQVALYDRTLTAAEVSSHAYARTGFYGEHSDDRIRRYLTGAGLAPTDMNLDASTLVLNTYPQAGKDIVTACQDVAVTEGGGSVFYVDNNGQCRFTSRTFRKPTSTSTLARTNYCANPAFEVNTSSWSASGGAPVATNLMPNPNWETNITGATSYGDGTLSWASTAYVGSHSLGATNTSNGNYQFGLWTSGTSGIPVTAGSTYTVSMYVKSATVARVAWIRMVWSDAAGALLTYPDGSPTNLSNSTWTRVTLTATAPANAAYLTPRAWVANGLIGEVQYFDAIQVEKAGTASAYFDGSTAAGGGFAYAWTGTANASTSTRTQVILSRETGAPVIRGFGSGKFDFTDGSCQISTGSAAATAVAGEIWSVSFSYKTSGALTGANPKVALWGYGGGSWTEFAVSRMTLPLNQVTAAQFTITGTVPVGVTQVFPIWFGAGNAGTVWIDDVLLTKGIPTSVTYFDGATSPTAGGYRYAWTGTANASTSTEYLYAPTVTMSLDADLDLEGSAYHPSFDEVTLVNSSTVNRSAESGTLSTQTFTDANSVATYGLAAEGAFSSYAAADADAMTVCQEHVVQNAWPGFRLPQVATDLVTALTSHYGELGSIQIGSRIRVTNLPAGLAPRTMMDVMVEGWTEAISSNSYLVTFDTDPADLASKGVYDDVTFGRYGCDGQTLQTGITSSDLAFYIVTPSGKAVFTTTAASYPMNLLIDQEIIILLQAPSGPTSPQYWSNNVVRGAYGTPAAAHATGATVNISPSNTYA